MSVSSRITYKIFSNKGGQRNSEYYDGASKKDVILEELAPYVVEMLGTFFLMLTVGLNVTENNPGYHAPLAIGSVLMVLIFYGGHISGANYNPAVTIGNKFSFKLDQHGWFRSLLYIIAQILGALIGMLLTWGFTQKTFQFEPAPGYRGIGGIIIVLLLEFFYTFLLVSIMINVATTESQAGNSFFGLAIGFTVLAAGYTIGGITGGALNPALAIAAAFVNLLNKRTLYSFQWLWIYLIACTMGGVVAGLLFRLTNAKEFRNRKQNVGDTIRDVL